LLQFVGKRLRFEGSSLRSRDEQYQGKLRDQLHDHALPKFKDGSFKVLIEKVFDWKDIQDAHRLMESNKVSYQTFDERSCERLLISSAYRRRERSYVQCLRIGLFLLYENALAVYGNTAFPAAGGYRVRGPAQFFEMVRLGADAEVARRKLVSAPWP